MDSPSTVMDNVTELLVKIIEFTEERQKLLASNIRGAKQLGYIPRDLQVSEFCGALNIAIMEHATKKRLLLCDSDCVKFGAGGSMQLEPIADEYSVSLLNAGKHDEYLEHQISKLLENSLNQRVAAELLRQKQNAEAFYEA